MRRVADEHLSRREAERSQHRRERVEGPVALAQDDGLDGELLAHCLKCADIRRDERLFIGTLFR